MIWFVVLFFVVMIFGNLFFFFMIEGVFFKYFGIFVVFIWFMFIKIFDGKKFYGFLKFVIVYVL